MILSIRYFFEKKEDDYLQYLAEWNENDSRIIYLGVGLSDAKQMNTLLEDIQNNPNKDILAIRYPDKHRVTTNAILTMLQYGEGIVCSHDVWFPKEVWIYLPYQRETK
uniref:Uncharacterized protein n=1 Tax=viral metagenome TaxID=1070528 RepID=A0A6C0I535_9ZZZZ